MSSAARFAAAFLASVCVTGVAVGANDQTPTVSGRITTVQGTAWNADNTPVKNAHLRLRNVTTGRIETTAIGDDLGRFTFSNIDGGTYLVELVSESGRILAVGQVFAIAPGETVATFVRLGTKVPWFAGFFNNAAAAAASVAAAQGITALAPVARPATAGK